MREWQSPVVVSCWLLGVLTYKEYKIREDVEFLNQENRVIVLLPGHLYLLSKWPSILEDVPRMLRYLCTVNHVREEASVGVHEQSKALRV